MSIVELCVGLCLCEPGLGNGTLLTRHANAFLALMQAIEELCKCIQLQGEEGREREEEREEEREGRKVTVPCHQ